PEQIIHFKFPNLLDPYGEGRSPLQAAWQRVQIGVKELGYLDSQLSNIGFPAALLSPTGDNFVGPAEQERLAKDYIQRFRGAGNGGIMVANGPMQLTPLVLPPKDLAELELYKV